MVPDTPASPRHIRLTSHPGQGPGGAPALRWGAADPLERGPVFSNTIIIGFIRIRNPNKN